MVSPRCVLGEPSRTDALALSATRVESPKRPWSMRTVATSASSLAQPWNAGPVEGVEPTSRYPSISRLRRSTKTYRLNAVLDVLTSLPQTWATVVDPDLHVVGTIALSDIVRNYRRTTQTYLRRLAETAGTTGLAELVIAANSRLVGHSLRSASIPRGALITSIERGTEVIRPTGDTVFHAGDRLTVLGAENEIDQLARASNSPPGHRDQA